MPSHTLHPAPEERGFILVGVVMFMLALTILGLSLFALSSYEAQFFYASTAREQSLQSSESGMELVKALLAAPASKGLEDAHLAEGRMGVTSAMAYQWRSASDNDTTSRGPVDWDSTMVIVVSARSGGVERTLQARYIPGVVENPYQRLLVAGRGVSVNTGNTSSPSVLELTGRVWQPVAADADTAWTDNVQWNSGRPVERGTPPAPLVDAFILAHLPGATDPSSAQGTKLSDHDSYEIDFVGSSGGPTFFQSPPSPTDAGEPSPSPYTFYIGDNLDIHVKGVAVWVIPQGACFTDRVKVKAMDSNVASALVIVAGPGDQNRGLWFKGGLNVNDENGDVPIYLVSQGDISIIHQTDMNHDDDANISIVAGGTIEIGGPQSPDELTLNYDASSMDALADLLLAQNALPQVAGGTGANFITIRQSWVETTPR